VELSLASVLDFQPGVAAAHLSLCSWGSPDAQHRNPESLGFDKCRFRGRPPEDLTRVAVARENVRGQPPHEDPGQGYSDAE
ncbi:hypothetical protein AK812_SmicGene46056, partial [Symbiodinium microadriaticum]